MRVKARYFCSGTAACDAQHAPGHGRETADCLARSSTNETSLWIWAMASRKTYQGEATMRAGGKKAEVTTPEFRAPEASLRPALAAARCTTREESLANTSAGSTCLGDHRSPFSLQLLFLHPSALEWVPPVRLTRMQIAAHPLGHGPPSLFPPPKGRPL